MRHGPRPFAVRSLHRPRHRPGEEAADPREGVLPPLLAGGVVVVRLLPGEHRIRFGSAIGKFAQTRVVVQVPTPEPVRVTLTPNPEARLVFRGGVPESRSKLWLRSGRKVEEHEFRGRDPFRFHADRDAHLGVYVKARGFLPAFLEHVKVPESGELVTGDITPTATELTAGDLNSNTTLDAGDVVILQRAVLGLIPPP